MDPQSLARDELRPELRQLALGEIRVLIEKVLSENELKDGIAQKLQALIVEMVTLRLMAQTGMRESLCQQERVTEFVAETLF